LRIALKKVKTYVNNENLFYSIYNSPRLTMNKEKIEEIIEFVKTF
jgi:hypothetical protein